MLRLKAMAEPILDSVQKAEPILEWEKDFTLGNWTNWQSRSWRSDDWNSTLQKIGPQIRAQWI